MSILPNSRSKRPADDGSHGDGRYGDGIVPEHPRSHGHHGTVHGERAGQERGAGDEQAGAEREEAQADTTRVSAEFSTHAPETQKYSKIAIKSAPKYEII